MRVQCNSTYLAVNKCSEREVVKEISKVFPDVRIAVLAQTLVVEAIDLRNLATLVVATQNCDAVFETNLKQRHCRVTNWLVISKT